MYIVKMNFELEFGCQLWNDTLSSMDYIIVNIWVDWVDICVDYLRAHILSIFHTLDNAIFIYTSEKHGNDNFINDENVNRCVKCQVSVVEICS